MPFDRVSFIRRPTDGQRVRHNMTPSPSSPKRFFVLFTRRSTDNSYAATCHVERNTAGFFYLPNKSSPTQSPDIGREIIPEQQVSPVRLHFSPYYAHTTYSYDNQIRNQKSLRASDNNLNFLNMLIFCAHFNYILVSTDILFLIIR